MEEVCRVLIIGDSLFTETLTNMLKGSESIQILGVAPTLVQALPMIDFHHPDVAIVVETKTAVSVNLEQLLAFHPDLPIIRANPTQTYVQIITSRRVQARLDDLLAVIQSLSQKTE